MKVRFNKLDDNNKKIAMQHIFTFTSSPTENYWYSANDVEDDISKGFNPDEYFTFYVDENNELSTSHNAW